MNRIISEQPAPATPFPGVKSEHTHEAQARGARGNGNHRPALAAMNHGPAKDMPSLALRDYLPLVEALLKRWSWLVLAALTLAFLGVLAGQRIWQRSYTVQVQLIRQDLRGGSDAYRPRPLSEPTLASWIRSPELLQQVAPMARPPLSPETLARSFKIVPERNSDILNLVFSGPESQAVVALANLYAEQVVRYTQLLQSREATEANRLVKQELARVHHEIETLNVLPDTPPLSAATSQPALVFPTEKPVDLLAERVNTQLILAREELVNLLTRFTEAHPTVQQQQARIAVIEKQLADLRSANLATTSPQAQVPVGTQARPPATTSAPDRRRDSDVIKTRLAALENQRWLLDSQQWAIQNVEDNAPGYYRIFAPATAKDLEVHGARIKTGMLALFLGLTGMAGAMGLILLLELTERRLKTSADVQRVTGLPVLTTLGDLRTMTPATQQQWAFRTWMMLQGRLSLSPNQGLVCGLTSAGSQEGRSTWINLLAQAASQNGFRVLTITTQRTAAPGRTEKADPPKPSLIQLPESEGTGGDHSGPPAEIADLSLTNVLSSPAQVTQQLTGPDAQPVVQIPLPGWVWNLERRKQWQSALADWQNVDNVVILVELPSADQPEAVLLAENLPNLIWLADSGRTNAAATREQLLTLRHARCNLVGAVLNHEPASLFKDRFPRWLSPAALALLLVGGTVQAADSAAPAGPAVALAIAKEATNAAFSAVSLGKLAPWQERLTLGSGDVLNFFLYGQPELAHADVFIGPDGRVSYLEAQEIMAAGLTIDELRDRFDAELAKYRRAPRTMITPVSFRSKKYVMLGKVAQKGVFVLDRPLTIIEAVARAHGLETGLFEHTTVEVADLSRSFLVRQGQPVKVDFERLFQTGDLSQNIPLEPNDYLYFAPSDVREVYVLGEVKNPGPYAYLTDATALASLSARGGFTEKAYRQKILVIRGSLNHPETFVIDAKAILSAQAKDFKLQPKDIVYVAIRPWARVEELVDLAATAFVQSAVITVTGMKVGP